MTDREAIDIRCSRRSYIKNEIESQKVKKLQNIITDINETAKLNFKLVINRNDAFSSMKKTYGLFKNVNNYVIICGKKVDNIYEQMGYYGEKFVLEATKLELGTCWVGGSFDKEALKDLSNPEEIIYGVIAFGNSEESITLKEKLIAKAFHRKTKSMEEMYEYSGKVPDWFVEGMKAVQKAPSAVNGQPVKFYWNDSVVTARVPGEKIYQYVDLGIAMYHFEIGAGKGKWEIRNEGRFAI